MERGVDTWWDHLVDVLATVGSVTERAPDGLSVVLTTGDGSTRVVEVVMTPDEWDDMCSVGGWHRDSGAQHVRRLVLEQPPGKPYLVYNLYRLVPLDEPAMPVDPAFARMAELAAQHPGGIPGGAWSAHRPPAPQQVDATAQVSLRAMTPPDVPAVIEAQETGAVIGLAAVFPQDEHPFPREVVARRWVEEIASHDVDCLVVEEHGAVIGFAAVRADELMHFGIDPDHWGTGAAQAAHDAVLERMRSAGVTRAWLRVFTGNERGRRFYERLGWTLTGERSRSTFEPFPELLQYARELSGRTRDA